LALALPLRALLGNLWHVHRHERILVDLGKAESLARIGALEAEVLNLSSAVKELSRAVLLLWKAAGMTIITEETREAEGSGNGSLPQA
jgi:hypothetical protein